MTDLNQEDIDKLLSQSANKEKDTKSQEIVSAQQNDKFSANDTDTLGEISNIFMGSAATTLSTLLNTRVEITAPLVEFFDSVENSYVVKGDHLLVEITYTQGLQGKVMLALKKEDAAVIADLMMGGTGKPENSELDEMRISAVGEAMNQMIGSASTALSNMLNCPINISHPDIKLMDKNKKGELNQTLSDQKVVTIKFNLMVSNLIKSEIIQFMSVDSAKNQIEQVTNMMQNVSETLKTNSRQSVIDTFVQEEQKQSENGSVTMTPPSIENSQAYNQQFTDRQPPQNQVTVQPVQFASFDNTSNQAGGANQNLNLVMDVNLGLTVELGRTKLPIKNILELTRGSIIELDKVAGEPVELYVNGKLIAKGEVVVIEDNFGLRITSIISPEQRIKQI